MRAAEQRRRAESNVLRARTAKSSICNDQLLLEDVGLYLYCTRLGHHSGLHEARDLEDKVVASWPGVVEARPRVRGATVRPEHQEWIRHYVDKHDGKLLGRCHSACAEMRKAFPELVEVRGHVYDAVWGKRGHVWLRAADGIVDPTAKQFPRLLAYQPWKPGDEVLVGKCHECGKEIWVSMRRLDDPVPRREFCDAICSGYFARSLQS